MISFTYEYKLKPTKKQIKDIEMYLDICRGIYNSNHRERKDWIQSRKSPIDRCSIVREYTIPAAARKLKSLQRRLKNKIKGSASWLKLQKKIAQLHFKVANRREDWLYKLAHHFCSITDNIFVEDINFKSWQKGLFGKQVGNSAIGKFINQILPFIARKTGVYFLIVDKDFTSQECPSCGLPTGQKSLSQRVHNCQYCGVTLDRDVAAAKVIENRGIVAVGQPVNLKNACGDRGAGIEQLTLFDLVTGL